MTTLARPTTDAARRTRARRRRAGAGHAFDNGFGGVTAEGDYLIRVHGNRVPPAPWANVIANPRGGFVVSERGAGFTWAENSYFFRLTPWHNDPVSDPATEVIYLRDDDTGALWSATPAPVRHDAAFTVRHAPARRPSRTNHAGIGTELTLGMAGRRCRAGSRILRLTNHDRRRAQSHPHGLRRMDSRSAARAYPASGLHQLRPGQHGAIFARNYFDPQFAEYVAFQAISEPVTGYTADRREFLGRNGTLADPAALWHSALLETTGGGIDPCAVLQCTLELTPGETREIVVAARRRDAASTRPGGW